MQSHRPDLALRNTPPPALRLQVHEAAAAPCTGHQPQRPNGGASQQHRLRAGGVGPGGRKGGCPSEIKVTDHPGRVGVGVTRRDELTWSPAQEVRRAPQAGKEVQRSHTEDPPPRELPDDHPGFPTPGVSPQLRHSRRFHPHPQEDDGKGPPSPVLAAGTPGQTLLNQQHRLEAGRSRPPVL